MLDASFLTVWIDENVVVSLNEAIPLSRWWYLIGGCDDIPVGGASVIGLISHDLVKLAQPLLHSLNNVGLKPSKLVLPGNNVVSVAILLDDLFVEAVVDLALEDIWIIGSLDLTSAACLLPQSVDVLLRVATRFVDRLRRLARALVEVLRLVLDLGVQLLENRQHRALQGLCRLAMAGGKGLRGGSEVLEQARNAAGLLLLCRGYQPCAGARERAPGKSIRYSQSGGPP